jgi:predicted Zn-dependent protease
MYNLLIAIGAAVLAFILGFVVSGWVAGIVPALLALAAVYLLLARRSQKQLEAQLAPMMPAMQAGNLDEVRAILRGALPLGKWQFLVEAQIESQLGQVDYLDAIRLKMMKQLTAASARFAEAKPHLERAWSRDWRAKAVLAAIQHRENKVDDAVATLEAVKGAGKAEVVYWGLYAWILNEAKRRDEALQVLGEGLKENDKSKTLRAMQEALSNRRRPNMAEFGEAWFTFFPEDIPREKMQEMAQAQAPKRSPMTYPAPRR